MALNPKRSQPTSGSDISEIAAVIRELRQQIEELESVAVRGLPVGYRFEITAEGPVVVDFINNRAANLVWVDK